MSYGIRTAPGKTTRPTEYDITVEYRGALDDCLRVYYVVESRMRRAAAHIDGNTKTAYATLSVRWQGTGGSAYADVLREVAEVHEEARDEGITDQPLDAEE